MYELFVRFETLFLGLTTPVLLGVGLPVLGVGLVFWLGGSRYSTVIVGLLGAAVGSVAGLLISQWLGVHLWLCMLAGAAVLATASVMLRNVLILVLAVAVIAAVSGAGYLTVLLDRMAPPKSEQTAETRTGFTMPMQSFTDMDRTTRLNYVDKLAKEQTFRERLRAVLDNTWTAVEPHAWKVGISVLGGGLVAIFLVWLVKKALIALAYSVVGTAMIFIGAQIALLGAGVAAVSGIGPRPWVLPGAFLGMTGLGWAWQLLLAQSKGARHEHDHHHDHHHDHDHDHEHESEEH